MGKSDWSLHEPMTIGPELYDFRPEDVPFAQGFQRTYEELKRRNHSKFVVSPDGFQRTYEELKLIYLLQKMVPLNSFSAYL